MYTVMYDEISGNVCGIKQGNGTVPICEGNMDYRAFLAWNAKQAEPLDWQTPILVEVPLPVPSTEERIAAMEDTILAMLLGG
jgi:hypothetical protein